MLTDQESEACLNNMLEQSSCKLTYLALNALKIQKKSLNKMIESLSSVKNLKALKFEKNQFNSQSIKSLCRAIGGFKSFESLSLAHCNIEDRLFSELTNQLQSKTLKELDISWNLLTGDSCYPLQNLLKKNQNLTSLHAQHNSLGGTSFNDLCDTLSKLQVLKYLDISHNSLTNQGFEHLFMLISSN